MFKRFALAAVAAVVFALPAMAGDHNDNHNVNHNVNNGSSLSGLVAGGVVGAGNVAGSSASSGIVGGSALAGITTGRVGNISTSDAATQATTVVVPGGIQSTVLNQHSNQSLSGIDSASLGFAGNAGWAGGAAASQGTGFASGGFLGLNVNIQP